ncbi:MAG TPA: transglycosylase SLT domain-containing protein [Pyrinomonadaceae bacterium]|nr:transglycosylase SLT domain-containing protein [Pyrinomonadaceae bacterium]
MRIQRIICASLAFAICLLTTSAKSTAQSAESYQNMTQPQRSDFVAEQARRLARQMSGRDYEFTANFDAQIQKAVDFYARRIGNNGGDKLGRGEARFIFERGQTVAPTLSGIFKARGVSPLVGIYIPLVESEYLNLQSPNSVGAIGMFQFLPQTGAQYGLASNDLLDVPKSADAAARYIAAGLHRFRDDPMKEALALLAYNRGAESVERDLAALVNEQNRACSICALTEQSDKLDANFRNESVYYVPRFFAAAIIGENPRAFGLPTPPLSTL